MIEARAAVRNVSLPTYHLPVPPPYPRLPEEVSAPSRPLIASYCGFWLTQTCRLPLQRMRKKDKAICFHKEAIGGRGTQPTTHKKNVRQTANEIPKQNENKKVKYADVVCNSSPATDVTGIVSPKCF